MFGRMARGLVVSWGLLASGCTPELGDVPFSCGEGDVCPDGYSCQSTVCVRDGAAMSTQRPKRVSWINPAEMYWFAAKDGGAALVVNDGFTLGGKGIYEIRVSPGGVAEEPRALFRYGDGPTISSAIVALPDGRYGVVTHNFPNIDGDETTLELVAIERDAPSGTTPAIEKLFTAKTPYLGGAEPAYVGAVIDGTTMHVAWTVPSDGGNAEVLTLERQGSLWSSTGSTSLKLPEGILPLSGDCQLFRGDDGFLTLRVGFEGFAIARLDPTNPMPQLVNVAAGDTPLFGWKEGTFVMRKGQEDPSAGTYQASFLMLDPMGMKLSEDAGFSFQTLTFPFVGVPFEGGVLVAPVSKDASTPTIDVAWRSPTEPLRIVASVPRESTEPVYTARAFGVGNVAYVAWTEFHESSMDLWIGTAPLLREGAKALSGHAPGARGSSRRLLSISLEQKRSSAWRSP